MLILGKYRDVKANSNKGMLKLIKPKINRGIKCWHIFSTKFNLIESINIPIPDINTRHSISTTGCKIGAVTLTNKNDVP